MADIKRNNLLNISVNINGDWKNASKAFVNIDGNWKTVEAIYINIDGVWKAIGQEGENGAESYFERPNNQRNDLS